MKIEAKTFDSAKKPSKSVVCTLSENAYHYGVGALVNSLFASGFRGDIYCGYRGDLPTWTNCAKTEEREKAERLKKIDEKTYIFEVAEGLKLYFVKLDTRRHFAIYKPRFMIELLKGAAKDAEQIFYFDPDIIVKCPWSFVEAWPRGGVGLCEDEFAAYSGYLASGHPLRTLWKDWLKQKFELNVLELNTSSNRDRYYNSGFVGIEAKELKFLELWDKICDGICKEIGTEEKINFGKSKTDLFYLPDQHALNMATMYSDILVNGVGIEGMDFGPKGFLLSHAVRSPKPWCGGFLQRALFGKAPREAERNFVKHLQSPIKVFPAAKTAWLKLSIKLAKEISR
jgi:hypothetical protein